ncbi:MAG: mannose-6-phosphate isomerase, class I [Candidatus Nanopelagicales bacterium]|nr:mannose-6-phosphate isomerase, class I [Candidatus Nanopelagicales bacterium]
MALVVRGAIKDYDWGIIDGLAPWAGVSTGAPQAELWFGVHPGGPSPLVDPAGETTGTHLASLFDVESIPLLVKLLAAARPLSVQVHPRRLLAQEGYDAQIADPDAPRIYADPFEKTELLIALEPFQAFAGWRDPATAARFLEAVGLQAQTAALDAAIALVRAGEVTAALPLLLAASSAPAIACLAAAAREIGLSRAQVDAYAVVAAEYPDDPGALLTPLLDHVELAAGEAVFLPAGVPHSYISGIGVEVMTSSDNVIRLGLTSKPVFVEQALAVLDADAAPQVIRVGIGDTIWPVSSPFVARLLSAGSERMPAGAYRIALAIEGTAKVFSEGVDITLHPGTAAVMSAVDPDARIDVDGLVAVIQSTER